MSDIIYLLGQALVATVCYVLFIGVQRNVKKAQSTRLLLFANSFTVHR